MYPIVQGLYVVRFVQYVDGERPRVHPVQALCANRNEVNKCLEVSVETKKISPTAEQL